MQTPLKQKIINCLGNSSKDFTISNIKKIGLSGALKSFSVDFILLVLTIF